MALRAAPTLPAPQFNVAYASWSREATPKFLLFLFVCGAWLRPAGRACVRMRTEAKSVALHSDSTQQVAQPAAGDALFVRFDPVVNPRVCVNA